MASTQPNVDFDDLAGYHKPLPDRPLSEEEFVAWCDEGVKAEWVDGRVIVMSPANTAHARLTTFLMNVLSIFVQDRGLGEVFGPELMTRLGPRSRRVPDLMFVAKERLQNLRPNHLEGAPDLAMEIVSPDSVERDWREKYDDYQAAGVREYWVIDPANQRVEAYRLVDGAYQRLAHDQGRVASSVLGGFYLREEWLWRAELPKVRDVLQEIESAN
ncbi:MAG TPA: Uma2 family endonuclease [Pirellulales bacterium]|jgi:Uma2 family endonuclease|nr:Uma2 family endonuclease [Pirellulales bacterium]